MMHKYAYLTDVFYYDDSSPTGPVSSPIGDFSTNPFDTPFLVINADTYQGMALQYYLR